MENNGHFEEAWRKALDNAEVTPSEKVWAGIEVGLSAQTSRRPFFIPWKRIAVAASLLLIGTLGAWWLFTPSSVEPSSQQPPLLATQEDAQPTTSSELLAEVRQTDPPAPIDPPALSGATWQRENRAAAGSILQAFRENGLLGISRTAFEQFPEDLLTPFPHLYHWQYPQGSMAYDNPMRKPKNKQKDKTPAVFYVRFSGASNYFEPNFRMEASSDYSRNYRIYNAVYSMRPESSSMDVTPLNNVFEENLASQRSVSAPSFSVGGQVGALFFKHWLVQAGVYYQQLRTASTVNVTFSDLEGGAQYPLAVNAVPNRVVGVPTINFVSNYTLFNTLNVLSIPLETGVQINRKRGFLALRAGVAANIFLRNTLTADVGSISAYRLNRSDALSPYRPLTWSGMLGGELSLLQTRRYAVSLEATYWQSFGNIAVQGASFSARPQSVQVGLSARYLFVRTKKVGK